MMDDKRQQAIVEIQRVANLLGVEVLSQREFTEMSSLSISTIRTWFGSWNKAVEAAGLKPIVGYLPNPSAILSEDDLLTEIIRLTYELNKKPTMAEMEAFGRFSTKPYRDRWGKFNEAVKIAYAKYGYPTIDPMNETIQQAPLNSAQPIRNKPSIRVSSLSRRKKTQYGEPLDFRGLRHAPVNEQGVVYMFGMVSKELGFLIESLRTAYPDCEGKRCVDEKRQLWENVLIEFEFKSSNFREPGHNPDECDLIVCWIHDWVDCPLEVLELRSEIKYLPSI